MKLSICHLLIIITMFSCDTKVEKPSVEPVLNPITGTWKLLTATIIEKADTIVTDYTKNVSFIKIINDSHFAFIQHDLNKGKDSAAVFSAGAGTYVLKDSLYTEHLEYCNAREWEEHDFTFTVTVSNDTLVQSGIEKIESEGINRINTEKYVRVRAKR
ncbi:MAG TPA: hypothetical protein VKA49_10140 [Flavitalea sp.]|nr:hypothetical protein [Flavitalea sp.]